MSNDFLDSDDKSPDAKALRFFYWVGMAMLSPVWIPLLISLFLVAYVVSKLSAVPLSERTPFSFSDRLFSGAQRVFYYCGMTALMPIWVPILFISSGIAWAYLGIKMMIWLLSSSREFRRPIPPLES